MTCEPMRTTLESVGLSGFVEGPTGWLAVGTTDAGWAVEPTEVCITGEGELLVRPLFGMAVGGDLAVKLSTIFLIFPLPTAVLGAAGAAGELGLPS